MQTPPYTPESLEEVLQGRSDSRSQGQRRPRISSSVSNASSEDGAVFLGKAPPRALTPRPRHRRPEPIADTQQTIATLEEDTVPQSPIDRVVLWLEGYWAQRSENELLRELNRFLFITLAFVVVRHLTWECPPQDSSAVMRGNLGDSAWSAVQHNPWAMVDTDTCDSGRMPASALRGDLVNTSWSLAGQSMAKIQDPASDIAAPHPGVAASAVWTFVPAALANALPTYRAALPSLLQLSTIKQALQPSNMAGAILPFVRNKFFNSLYSGATSAMTPAREPDVHGWDVVVANQERRKHFLSVLGDMEEVSSHLYLELSSQLFQGSAQNSNSEQISAIEQLEGLKAQLEELKTHQYELVR